jgi:uncharacterized protein YuzE
VEITYDKDANAAYVTLVASIARGEVRETIPCESPAGTGYLFVDFDSEGRLLGIEILGARRMLPPEVLQGARQLP